MLRIEHLYKSFSSSSKKITALDDINCALTPENPTLLLGPNGSGKTTLLKCIYGLLFPDHGNIITDHKTTSFISSKIDSFYPRLSLARNLEFFCYPYFLNMRTTRNLINRFFEMFDLNAYRDMQFQQCSQGIKKRAGLIRGLVHEPEILLIDEWDSALDTTCINTLTAYIQNRPTPPLLLCSSHNIQKGQALFNNFIMLQTGKVVFTGDRQALRACQNKQGIT